MRLLVSPGRHVGPMLAEHRVDLVLSLISPDAEAPNLPAGGPPGLVLRFNDIAQPRDGLIPPSRALMARVLDATETAETILIHCYAGISRSTAAAYVLACRQVGAGCEADLAKALRRLSPSATPNPLMIKLADDLMDRGERMVRAIKSIGRGMDAYEGQPIDWRL